MKALRLLTTITLGAGLGLGGYWSIEKSAAPVAAHFAAAAAADRVPLYYRDPGGAPHWSAVPKKDAQGRDYLPVYNDRESSTGPAKAKPQEADPARRILYYRNPMGLPDTSPLPKKDPMGMSYVPVYEGDDTDDGIVKLSPGKIQRTGVKSEPVERRPIQVSVRAPGTIQLD